MLRVIFDTNIYGKIIEEQNFEEIATKIKNDQEFKVYGFQVMKVRESVSPRSKERGLKRDAF